MTAYELRRHLAEQHDVRMIGADYATLLTIHDIEHRNMQEHEHEDRTHAL